MALSAGLATIAGLFGNKLTWIVNQVTKDSSLWEKIKAVLIKVTLFLAALALPIILWLIYLQLCVWGIATDSPGQPSSSAPGWIQTLAGWTLAGKAYVAGLMSRLVEPTSGLGRLLSHLVTDSAVGLLYFVMFALFVFASFVLGPNANSLHRLLPRSPQQCISIQAQAARGRRAQPSDSNLLFAPQPSESQVLALSPHQLGAEDSKIAAC
jgi:cytochrome b561